MWAVAVRLGQVKVRPNRNYMTMGTVICSTCGARFGIGQHRAYMDLKLAETQVKDLEEILARDHEEKRQHALAIDLG